MKHLLFKMVIVGTLIISAFESCSKHEYLPVPTTGDTSQLPVILNLTASQWEAHGGNIYVNTFKNVISGTPNYVKIFLKENGTETSIDHAVRFGNGVLWATSTQADIRVFFRGTLESPLYVNIKVMIG